MTSETVTAETPVQILYTNYRGETAVRKIVPHTRHPVVSGKPSLWFGSTQWHPEPQWLLTAVDVEKGAVRDWALSGIKAWGEEAVSAALASTAGAGAGDWVTVPREPTPEMQRAYEHAYQRKANDVASPTPTEFYEDGGGPFGYGYSAMIKAAPAAAPAARPAEDWAAVPKVPTDEMLFAGIDRALSFFRGDLQDARSVEHAVYRAMIEAAPAVPASPRSGAGEGEEADDHAEELRQPQPVKVVARLLRKHDGTARVRARHYDMARQILSALSQGGGAGRSEKGEGDEEGREAVLDYLFGPNGRGWITVTDLAYTAFMRAKGKNDEDGGPTDWFTDTKPLIEKGIATMRARVEEMLAPAQSPSTSDAEG